MKRERPAGVCIPRFWFQDYQRRLEGGQEESLAVYGAPQWRVRFTPAETGNYSVQVSIRQDGQPVGQPVTASFTVSAPDPGVPGKPGYVRVAANGRYFETDERQCGAQTDLPPS